MSSNKTVNDKCYICSKLVKKVSGTPKTLLTEQDIDEFSTAFDIDFFTGDIVCGKCRLELYKKRKVDPDANGFEDESESIVSELLERTESSLSQMTLSQLSSRILSCIFHSTIIKNTIAITIDGNIAIVKNIRYI
ncbi:hypothetical protein KQX54_013153 [Cotesia glomerata]|uniref:Uncharacterized protein n=1 Tax=Cotesia glomerata TaxID=32391 RepID=A0AAV7J8Q6_COTGL|nr:hypothetical protein KQX54_013153 [Cotesia glomerata]